MVSLLSCFFKMVLDQKSCVICNIINKIIVFFAFPAFCNKFPSFSALVVSSKDRCKTPDSPEGARLGQTLPPSPTQSSPTIHHINGSTSPVNNGSAGSLTPPLPSSGSLSVNLEGNHHQYAYTSPITRPLVKVKRFLSTLVQFGNDIGTDVGDRVRSLVLSLVVSRCPRRKNVFTYTRFFRRVQI